MLGPGVVSRVRVSVCVRACVDECASERVKWARSAPNLSLALPFFEHAHRVVTCHHDVTLTQTATLIYVCVDLCSMLGCKLFSEGSDLQVGRYSV